MGILQRAKRGYAKYRIAQRKRDEAKLHKLEMQRNQAVRDADMAVRKAKLIEDRQDALRRKAKATGPSGGQRLVTSLVRGVKVLAKDIQANNRPRRKARRRRS